MRFKDLLSFFVMLKETRFLIPSAETITIKVLSKDRTKKNNLLGYSPNIEETKNKISLIKPEAWIRLRKLTNPLDYPFKSGLSRPISRAFFKMLEIIKDNNIDVSGNSFHLCEAPGGFIQATNYIAKKNKVSGTRYTFSLIGSHRTPVYNAGLVSNRNVIVLSNAVNGGDIYSIDNIRFLISSLKPKSIKLITADGGFSETNDFSNKEQLHHRLIFNQIICALHILENGGDFVIKIFDIFTELTFDYVYLLSHLFGKVYVHKPNTSRPTNSERYVCCKNYIRSKFTPELMRILRSLCEKNIENFSSFVSKADVPMSFVSKLRESNRYFSDYQVYSINNIMDIRRLNLKVKQNTCITESWLKKYFA
jgi:cap2 methyltransferase